MQSVKAIAVVFCFFLIGPGPFAQAPQTDEEIPAAVKTYMLDFLSAYNSGDTLQMESFIKESHHPKVLEQVPIKQLLYRLSYVYYQYGPVEGRVYKKLSPGTAIVWTRGTLSKAWVGFQLFFTPKEPFKITTIGIDRGQSPLENEWLKPAADETELILHVSSYLKRLKNTPFFSGSLAISHHAKKLIHQTTGYSDRKNKIRNTGKSLFLIASASKLFTGVAILQLKERGWLSLNDLLSKYIPEYPRHIADSVTIFHLLTHTSGIELDEIPGFRNSAPKSIKELVDVQIRYIPEVKELSDYKLPGEFNYTNEGYALLARIIEVVTKMDYWDYIEKFILKPAGLSDTFPLHKAGKRIVKGYTCRNPDNGSYNSAIPAERTIPVNTVAHPAGGLVSTTEDLLKFAHALLNNKLITPDSFLELKTPLVKETDAIGYGFGIRIYNTRAGNLIGHAGDVLGYNCRLDIYPDTGYVVAVLSNQDQAAKNLADYINEILPVKN